MLTELRVQKIGAAFLQRRMSRVLWVSGALAAQVASQPPSRTSKVDQPVDAVDTRPPPAMTPLQLSSIGRPGLVAAGKFRFRPSRLMCQFLCDQLHQIKHLPRFGTALGQ